MAQTGSLGLAVVMAVLAAAALEMAAFLLVGVVVKALGDGPRLLVVCCPRLGFDRGLGDRRWRRL